MSAPLCTRSSRVKHYYLIFIFVSTFAPDWRFIKVRIESAIFRKLLFIYIGWLIILLLLNPFFLVLMQSVIYTGVVRVFYWTLSSRRLFRFSSRENFVLLIDLQLALYYLLLNLFIHYTIITINIKSCTSLFTWTHKLNLLIACVFFTILNVISTILQ